MRKAENSKNISRCRYRLVHRVIVKLCSECYSKLRIYYLESRRKVKYLDDITVREHFRRVFDAGCLASVIILLHHALRNVCFPEVITITK